MEPSTISLLSLKTEQAQILATKYVSCEKMPIQD
jgi:hypothetical protein